MESYDNSALSDFMETNKRLSSNFFADPMSASNKTNLSNPPQVYATLNLAQANFRASYRSRLDAQSTDQLYGTKFLPNNEEMLQQIVAQRAAQDLFNIYCQAYLSMFFNIKSYWAYLLTVLNPTLSFINVCLSKHIQPQAYWLSLTVIVSDKLLEFK